MDKRDITGEKMVVTDAKFGATAVGGGLAAVAAVGRKGWKACTPAGRSAIVACVACWLLGLRLGWEELFLAAACCLIAMVIAAGFMLGKPGLDITVELDPSRVTAGQPAAGRLIAVNRSRNRLRRVNVELPAGQGLAIFQVPSLAGKASHEELFVVPTSRRQVIPLGPARAVRTDPLGLLRRDTLEGAATELFVHPKITPLESLAAGLQRDLEGQATRDLSTSDLAFHALRDYQPGDDRRHVHWRTTAKAGRLVVRQYQDTRRLQLTIVVDGATASYASHEEAELAMSVAGSIAARVARDSQEVYLVAASHAVGAAHPRRLLDTIARGTLADVGQDLATLTSRTARLAPDTSVAMLITGSVIPFSALKAATVYFGPDVAIMAIRCEPDAPPGISRSGGLTVLAVRALADLPLLLATAVSS
jgi:uncharacterized protein (DUF58 family)